MSDDAVFTAGGTGAVVKKRKAKKRMVEVEDEQYPPTNPTPTSAQQQPEEQPQQQQFDSDPTPVASFDDEDGPNPLADLMGSAARDVEIASVAAPAPAAAAPAAASAPVAAARPSSTSNAPAPKKKSSTLAYSALSSSSSASSRQGADLIDAAASLSSFANPASASERSDSTAVSGGSNARKASSRDAFDSDLDNALNRRGVTATSSGYIDEADLRAIERARAKKQQQAAGQPEVDEFEFDEVAPVSSAASLASSGAGGAKSSGAQFDEFADVWDAAEAQLNGRPTAVGGRKVLKASNAQKKVEKLTPAEEAKAKREADLAALLAKANEDEERRQRQMGDEGEPSAQPQPQTGLQNSILAKLGIAPTNILDQYDDTKRAAAATTPAASPTASSSASGGSQIIGLQAAKKAAAEEKARKPKREQDMLESTDADLLPASAPPQTAAAANAVEALVAAHTGGGRSSSAAAASSSSSSSAAAASSSFAPDAAESAQLEQWGAVNSLREQQEAAARAEAARVAKAGKSIGLKAQGEITRDTPISYDAALKALTVGPSCPPPAEAAASSSSSSSSSSGLGGVANSGSASTAAQLRALKAKITAYDFRDIGFAKKMRFGLFPPRLKSPRLEEERDLVFCMALMKIDYAGPAGVDHERILCSLYRGLTGDALAPPTFGEHWAVIGFQGTDPSTDLRGAGLFSLIQLMWFLKHHRELMLRIYQLSLDERQNFPFCTLSTNLTGMVLQSLRECAIYGEARRQNSVYTVVHTLYVSAFYEMYLKWKNENCTIVQWNDVKQSGEQRQRAAAGEGGGRPAAELWCAEKTCATPD